VTSSMYLIRGILIINLADTFGHENLEAL
jgi:hypothetical protein